MKENRIFRLLTGKWFMGLTLVLVSSSVFATQMQEEDEVRKPAQVGAAAVTPAAPAPPPIPNDWSPTPAALIAGRCQTPTDPAVPTCKYPYAEPNVVAYEDARACADDRKYLLPLIARIAPAYRLPRNSSPEAQFPEMCIVHALRSFDAAVYVSRSSAFATCESESGYPVKGNKLPCVTKDYADSIYNSFVDVMDCLAIPQKEILPKLWNESAFHMNSINGSEGAWDGGVGQLTSSAIRSALIQRSSDSPGTELDYYVAEMRRSSKASCQRILSQPTAYQVVPSSSSERCGLIRGPANPLRNLLYMGIYYRTMVEQLTGITYRAGKEYIRLDSGWTEWNEHMSLGRSVSRAGIREKMVQLGIQNPSSKYLRQILVTLGFNAGQDHAVSLLNSYLTARLQENLTLSDADLDFMNTDTRPLRALLVAAPGETEEAKQTRLAQLAARRAVAHREPLPMYMRISQTVGSPGYLSVVSFFRAKKYNRELGENICTERGYMQHSY